VAGAMTGVKEQVVGSYAERIAKSGFVTLAIDLRHFGESEGENLDSMKTLQRKWKFLRML
jgi:hypothetical protein